MFSITVSNSSNPGQTDARWANLTGADLVSNSSNPGQTDAENIGKQ